MCVGGQDGRQMEKNYIEDQVIAVAAVSSTWSSHFRVWLKVGGVVLWLAGFCDLGAGASPVPDWVSSSGRSSRYPEAEFLAGFGVSGESFAEAEEQARNDLARQIEVAVEGVQEIVE